MNEPPASNIASRHFGSSLRAASSPASELIDRWPSDSPFDARAALEEHPELSQQRSLVLDLAYEEYCQRIQRGEALNPESFATAFPRVQRSLLQLIQLHSLMVRGIDLLEQPEPVWPQPGQAVLDFDLCEELGRGGLSRVFLARERTAGNREVVVKFSRRGSFEGHVLGKLRHPNIVPVYSVRQDPDSRLTAICMPFLSRVTLFHLLDAAFQGGPGTEPLERMLAELQLANRGCELPGDEAVTPRPGATYDQLVVKIAAQLARALAHTHARGVLHRDIKPSNVLVTSAGDALLFDYNLSADSTTADSIGGTLPYMPPEQLRAVARPSHGAGADVDVRSDLFSLAATLYELFCGTPPFGTPPDGQDREAVIQEMLRRREAGPQPLAARRPDLDPALAGLIDRALSFNPAARPQSADDFLAALAPHLSTPLALQPAVFSRRRLLALAGGALACGAAPLYGVLTRDPLQSARAARRKGDHAAAAAQFTRVLEQDPRSLEALYGRGRAHLALDNPSGAFSDFEAFANLQGGAADYPDGRIHALLGYAVALIGSNWDVAQKYTSDAIDRGFAPPEVRNNFGHCLLRQKDLIPAQKQLRDAVQQAQGAALDVIHHNQARVELGQAKERRPPSTTYIEQALAGPRSAELYLDAIRTYAWSAEYSRLPRDRTAHLDQAVRWVEEAVAVGVDAATIRAALTESMLPLPVVLPRLEESLKRTAAASPAPLPEAIFLLDPLQPADELY